MAVPTKDSSLATFALNFSTIVSAAPVTYGTTPAACTALTTAVTNFISAYNAARVDGMKSKSLTSAKDAAKAALLPLIRAMYASIQANVSVTDTQKVDLGITVRKSPSTQPAPSDEPKTIVESVTGRTVRLRLRDATNPHRVGKPVGVSSATVLSYVGENPPASISSWVFEGNVSRTVLDVTFPDTTAPGAKVWFTAFWSNRKDQPGPASDPISTYLQLGSVSMAA